MHPLSSVALFLGFRLLRNLYFHMAVTVPFYMGCGLDMTRILTLESAYYVAKVLSDVPTGLLADLAGRRLCLALSGFLAGFGYLTMGLGSSFGVFLVAEILLGVAFSLASGADSAAVYEALAASGRERWYARVEGAGWALRNCAAALAGAGGGLVAAAAGPGVTWFCTAGCVTAAGLLALGLPEPRTRPVAGHGGPVALLRQLAGFMRADRFAADAFLFFAAVYSVVRVGLFFLQPLLAGLGFGIAWNGMVYAGAVGLSIGFAALAATLFPTSRPGRGAAVFAAAAGLFFLAWGVGGAGLGAWSVVAGFAGVVLYSAMHGLYDPVLRGWVTPRLPAALRATLLSSGAMMANLLFAGIGPLAGWLTDRVGLSGAMLVLAVLHAPALVLLPLRLRRHAPG
ncbi:MFS transporter [Rhodovastum atsumiense]|uniref:MFS transporter n=1 Tax=Rhodovastum atsumiense TaxID=504468 RepID=A0A5M6IN91_9PROT|nr:MFS transporter [Rhodovastum atsumiense]KAA5609724.1 MFS transporter [Rhodovastum atsumiense]CAH2604493.1 MFS transporter [Rhodovastum atsumiense]